MLLQSIWIGILSAFIAMNCWRGLREARALSALEAAGWHEGFACPVCRAPPPRGAYWICGNCRTPFDTFETQATCPKCGVGFPATSCPSCGKLSPFPEWFAGSPPP